MAIKFNEVNGEAKKSNVDYYKFKSGENVFRMIGEVLPRYVYWVKSPDGTTNFPIECLGFDREQEKFTNIEKDWVQTFYPDLKCSWSYLVQVIDPEDGKLKVLGLKKKLFQSILDMAQKHLGDPTSTSDGWDVVVERKSTGPLPFNVEYSLDQLSCKNRPLTDEELEVASEVKDIDTLFPRPTPEEQKAFLDKLLEDDNTEDESDESDDDVPDELKG